MEPFQHRNIAHRFQNMIKERNIVKIPILGASALFAAGSVVMGIAKSKEVGCHQNQDDDDDADDRDDDDDEEDGNDD